jgi:exodeoxyribonuclease V alpha subunit
VESVAGLIERVTFHNPDSGFCVLRVQAQGRRDLTTVVGTTASVNAGEWVEATGSWGRDREHGLQFKADTLRLVPPSTEEGIEKYLGSGLIKGIGPVFAKKLVGKFGDKIFDVIETESGRLEDIPGVGPERRRRIKEAWEKQKVVREIMVFLHSHGVGTGRAVRIYKTYGERAVATVRANPYVLARDIHGIGFSSADKIARRVGIPEDSPLRSQAGVRHVLWEATHQGHCALPVDMLQAQAAKLLDLDESVVATAVQALVPGGELEMERIGGETLVFLPVLRAAEQAISSGVARLAAQGSAYPPMDLPKALEWCQEKIGITLAPSQRKAVEAALSHRVLVITGGPGVGKTTIVKAILRILQAKKVRVLLCAPTGRAAKRLSESTGSTAKTIHRLLEFDPRHGRFTRNAEHPLECDLLIVDETSMVDVPLMSRLLAALPEAGSLLMVGDVDQLPSVGPGSVLADLIESQAIPVLRLTEIFRQAAESRIIQSAHAINEGRLPEPVPAGESSDYFFIEREEPEEIASLILELASSRLPKKFGHHPLRDIQILTPMNRGSLGARELNLRLQEKLNPPRHDRLEVQRFGLLYRVGDKVIQLENNYDKEVFNGDIGFVRDMSSEEETVIVNYEGRDVLYDFDELDELGLAYALTVHKSQGSEFPAVILPVATQQYLLLQRNLIYTGVTRGRKLVVVCGQPKALAMAVRNHLPTQRYGALRERLRIGSS